MTHRTHSQFTIGSIALLLLATACGGGFDESAESTGTSEAGLTKGQIDPADPADPVTNQEVVIARGLGGLDAAPISATAKSMLKSDANAAVAAGDGPDSEMLYIVDRATAEQIGTQSKSGTSAAFGGCNDYYKDFPMQ